MPSFDPYAVVADELSAGQMDRALWLRSFTESGGDDGRAKATYVRHRVAQVTQAFEKAFETARQEAEQARREQIVREEQDRRHAVQRQEEIDRQHTHGDFRSLLVAAVILVAIIVLLSTVFSFSSQP